MSTSATEYDGRSLTATAPPESPTETQYTLFEVDTRTFDYDTYAIMRLVSPPRDVPLATFPTRRIQWKGE